MEVDGQAGCMDASPAEADTGQAECPDMASIDMDKLTASIDKDKLTGLCPVHADKITEYYCSRHYTTACAACVMEDHRTCNKVQYIPNISKGTSASWDCKYVQSEYNELIQKLNDNLVHASHTKRDLRRASDVYTQSTQTYRDELVGIIDDMVADAEKKRQVHVKKVMDKVNTATTINMEHLGRLEAAKSKVTDNTQARNENRLFVLLKESGKLIHECKKVIPKVQHDLDIEYCEFYPDTHLRHRLTSITSLGTTVKVRYPYLCDTVDVPRDRSPCNITGSHILPTGGCIVTDYMNKNVKLFTLQPNGRHRLTSYVIVASRPYDISAVSTGEVVVSLPDNKTIEFLQVSDNGLTPDRVIHTDVPCRSLARSGDKLIAVTYTGRQLVELDLDGSNVRTIQTYSSDYPWYVKVHPDSYWLYVSVGHTVRCVTRYGTEMWVYRDDKLKLPQGITIHPDGSMYVCGHDSNNVHHITSNGEKIGILFSEGEVKWPWSVCLDKAGNKLYVSETNKNIVKVFKLECSASWD